MIDAARLIAATGCTPERAAIFAPLLEEVRVVYGIRDVAQFLAQLSHESGAFRFVREIADGSAYEGRKSLGNTEPGDGPRFKGRGLIQITGRYNYGKVTAELRKRWPDAPDFVANPEALESLEWAARSAGAYWEWTRLNNAKTLEEATKIINGGFNGLEDRRARYARALRVFPLGEQMPVAPIIAAVLPSIVEAIPKLGKIFSSGSEVAERNVKAAETVVGAVIKATGAVNAQDAAEKVKADPAAAKAATQAIDAIWYDLTEAGGQGIDGARKADEETRKAGDMLHSPSFWVAVLLLPLVYLLVLSLIGMIGSANWSDDVRAGLAGSLISAIIGGLVGYYYGQTTSRNRTPA